MCGLNWPQFSCAEGAEEKVGLATTEARPRIGGGGGGADPPAAMVVSRSNTSSPQTPLPPAPGVQNGGYRSGSHGTMGGAQVQSLTPAPLKHFGPLKGGWGGGLGPKTPTATSCQG